MIDQMIKLKIVKQNNMINIRKRVLLIISTSFALLLTLITIGGLISPEDLQVNLQNKNLAPSVAHLFGTDWLGRGMLSRTLKGLTLSFGVGLLAAFVSTIIALVLSLLASLNKRIDSVVTWLIDLFLGVPHIISLMLISFAVGGGFKGVVIGLALTHWPSITRLLRGEVLQIKNADYVAISSKLGKSKFWIFREHILPYIIPQLIVGFILLFPHAILHEAAITFLGFGLSTEEPAIGIILSESMRYLSTGMWWLAFFPGISLLLMVGLFDILGRNVRRLLDPFHGQRL